MTYNSYSRLQRAALSLLIAAGFAATSAQANTFGVVLDAGTATDGYNLITSYRGQTVYLIDNAGRVVNQWDEPDGYGAGASMILTPQGTLVRTVLDGGSPFGGGAGIGGLIREYDWDGNIVWEYDLGDEFGTSHHTLLRMPNGRYMVTAYETQDCTGMAGCPEEGTFRGETFMEIQPNYRRGTGRVKWQWRVSDHLLPEGADAANNPGKWDLSQGVPNFNHIDYNIARGQLLISCNACNEILVIERTWTTRSARRDYGGRYGKGGDFLYRWGNPQNYGLGDEDDRQIGNQHGVRFRSILDEHGYTLVNAIEALFGIGGLNNIMIFNNGFSEMIEVAPPLTWWGAYSQNSDGTYGPEAPAVTYSDYVSPFMGNPQPLPNGHVLINAGVGIGSQGGATVVELDADGNEVWKFVNPVISTNGGGEPVHESRTPDQCIAADAEVPENLGAFFPPGSPTNWMFRVTRYSPLFLGFLGKDMTPGELLTDLTGPDCTLPGS